MRSLIKLDRAMQIKRIEGKAALEQCLLGKQTLKFTAKCYVQEHPWTSVGVSALLAISVAKFGKASRIKASISSIRLLLNGALDLNKWDLNKSLAKSPAPQATASAAPSSQLKADHAQRNNSLIQQGE